MRAPRTHVGKTVGTIQKLIGEAMACIKRSRVPAIPNPGKSCSRRPALSKALHVYSSEGGWATAETSHGCTVQPPTTDICFCADQINLLLSKAARAVTQCSKPNLIVTDKVSIACEQKSSTNGRTRSVDPIGQDGGKTRHLSHHDQCG